MTLAIRRSTPNFADFPAKWFDEAVQNFFNEPVAARPWAPAVDIEETPDALILTADLPGLSMENIDVRIEDGTLALSGERKFEKEDNKAGYHRIERSYGSFKRLFTLPDTVEADKVTAGYENGVLKITIPKKEVAKPRSIKVEVGK